MSPTQKKSSSFKSKKSHINVAKNIDKDLDKLTIEMNKYWNDGKMKNILLKNQVNEKFIIGGTPIQPRRRPLVSNTTTLISKFLSPNDLSSIQTPSLTNNKEPELEIKEKAVTIDYISAVSVIPESKYKV